MNERPLLILVASGMRPYREYLLRSIAQRYRVHLFHTVEPSWELPYLTGHTVLPSTIDGPAMAAESRRLHAADPVSGVLCWDEGRIHAASHIAQALGLPNGDPDVVWRLRDKAQTRAALAAAGVRQPRSVAVRTEEEAVAATAVTGYPAVLKPRGLGASLGVVRVNDEAELRAHFAFTRDTPAPDPVVYLTDEPVLVEQCVIGEEISVDSVVRHGVVTPLFVARKQVGFPPYAEEVGHLVSADDPLLTELAGDLQRVHAALGFTDGFTHTELMCTADRPSLIEVNGRLGGDMIPYLGKLATGIDPGLAAAAAACGREPTVTPTRRGAAGIRFFYVERDDTALADLGFDEEGLPEAVDQLVVLARPGAVVSPPPKGKVWDRIAYATAAADTVEECVVALDAATKAFSYTVR
jgi:biotin carboxylase